MSCTQNDSGRARVRRPARRRARVPREQRQHGRPQRDASTPGPAHLRHRPVPGFIRLPAHQRPLHTQTSWTQPQPPPRNHDFGQRDYTHTASSVQGSNKIVFVSLVSFFYCLFLTAERLEETQKKSSCKFANTAEAAQFLAVKCLSEIS